MSHKLTPLKTGRAANSAARLRWNRPAHSKPLMVRCSPRNARDGNAPTAEAASLEPRSVRAADRHGVCVAAGAWFEARRHNRRERSGGRVRGERLTMRGLEFAARFGAGASSGTRPRRVGAASSAVSVV